MPIHNEDIAAVFDEIADLLEIEGANPFRIRAYRNAARTLRALGSDIRERAGSLETLTRLPGIGTALAEKIQEILATGHCRTLEKLRRQLPGELPELLRLPGLGPRRVHALYHDLDIHTLEQLHRAILDGRVRQLPGFGERLEQRLLEALARQETSHRFRLATAARYATALQAYLEQGTGVGRVTLAGSYRRRRETVGDLDILVTARNGRAVVDHFVHYDETSEILSRGDTRATVILHCGLQVDLRVVRKQNYGAALHYFTGSRAHNIAIRALAQKQGLKINEYGIFRGRRRLGGEEEGEVFAAVGLPWIPPELRENRGEIEAARQGLLPQLVEPGDLRGDLHVHTRATDGHETIAAMAEAARARGFEYLAITEHSRHLTVAHGLDSRRLLAQIDEIDQLNERLEGIRLLKGIEVDILEDGRLDLPDRVLARLDLVVGAVHSRFHLSRTRQTERILRAMDHPFFTLLAHPTGRLIGEREPYDVDLPRIIRHARQRGCYLELNAHPERLDLLDTYCQFARDEGVLIAIDSDAHGIPDFDHLVYGIGQARRGWLEADDVLNTRPLPALLRLLAASRLK